MMHFAPRSLIVAAMLLMAPPAIAAPAEGWSGAERVEIVLSNFAFTPASLHLKAGHPYLLHFVNQGSGGHNFAARDFFAAARIRPGEAPAKGVVELKKGESRDIALAPGAGHFNVKCSHFLHASFGMKGEIVVD